jgi:hypothetical protein
VASVLASLAADASRVPSRARHRGGTLLRGAPSKAGCGARRSRAGGNRLGAEPKPAGTGLPRLAAAVMAEQKAGAAR